MADIIIPKGTIVEGRKSGMITLKGEVHASAWREEDGCYRYQVGEEDFRVSGGLVTAGQPLDGPWRHRDGLVALG